MGKRLRAAIFSFFLFMSFFYLLLFPEKASSAIIDALKLCAVTVVPSMFPYFLLTEITMKSGIADKIAQKLGAPVSKLFSATPYGAIPLFLGLIGGYPLGAKVIADLYAQKKISKGEAETLSGFSCNAGPAFIIGAVGGGLYRSVSVGLTLYGIHIVSALLCGRITRPKTPKSYANTPLFPSENPQNFADSLVHAVTSAAETTIKICSYIVSFSILISVQKLIFEPNTFHFCTIVGLTEMSTGCAEIAHSSLPWSIKFPLTSAILSFGGLCVFFQTKSVFSGLCIKTTVYLAGKIKQSIISFLISYPISFLFRPEIATSAIPITVRPISPFPDFFLPVLLFVTILVYFPSRNRVSFKL